jgi:hypothetical protein
VLQCCFIARFRRVCPAAQSNEVGFRASEPVVEGRECEATKESMQFIQMIRIFGTN